MTKKERITKLRETYQTFAGQPKDMEKIANALNEQGIKTARGLPWNPVNVRQQLNEHFPDLMEARPEKKAKKKKETPKETKKPRRVKSRKETPKEPPQKPSELIPLPVNRPTFKKGKQKQGTFKVKDEIYKRVLEKLETDRVRTRGNVASLVEILLWMYVGAPEDLL